MSLFLSLSLFCLKELQHVRKYICSLFAICNEMFALKVCKYTLECIGNNMYLKQCMHAHESEKYGKLNSLFV